MGYKVFFPEHKKIVIGVHVMFNEIILACSEIHHNEIEKLKILATENESTAESFIY